MNKVIRILHLEDLPTDAGLIERVLRKSNLEFEIHLVDTREDYEMALSGQRPDIILSDHSLPSFDSFGALAILKEKKLNIPFILITATISEEFAVEVMKQGADDYILKDRLQRLPNSVLSAIEKKRMEAQHQKFLEELIANEALLKETEYLANIGSLNIDLINHTEHWSEQLYSILDYKVAETTPSLETFLKRVHRDDVDRIRESYQNIAETPSPILMDYRVVTSGGGKIKFIHSELWVKNNENGQAIQVIGFVQDVTAQKKAEEKILKAYRLYAFISQVNQTIIHALDEKSVFRDVCRIAVNTGKFGVAWIGLIDIDQKKVSLIEEYGANSEDIKWFTDVSYENGPKEYVVKIGSYYVCNDISKEPSMAKLKSFTSTRGFGSCIMLPIKKADELYGIYSLYSSETNFFDFEEIKLLEEVVGDISYALDSFEKETQRKEAEEKLAHSEAILKEAQAIAHIGNWQHDLSTGISIWSEETCKIYGISPKDNRQTYESWLSFIHPQDLDYVQNLTKETMEAFRDSSFYHRIIRKDRVIRHIHTQSQFQFKDGKPIGINGVAHDVTEEKKAELALRKKEIYLRGILDSTDNGILAVDNDSKIINYNNHFIELWNIPKHFMNESDDTIIEYVQDQLVDPKGFISKIKELYNSDTSSFDILQLKEGKVYERYSNPLILNNEFVGRVWSFKDISERRKHILAIEEQNAKLSEIAWIQSHVVRAPLSRIMGLVEMLKKSDEDGLTRPDLLEHLFNSATELDKVIRSIVDKTENVVNLKQSESLRPLEKD